jgi:hypothetical protein
MAPALMEHSTPTTRTTSFDDAFWAKVQRQRAGVADPLRSGLAHAVLSEEDLDVITEALETGE